VRPVALLLIPALERKEHKHARLREIGDELDRIWERLRERAAPQSRGDFPTFSINGWVADCPTKPRPGDQHEQQREQRQDPVVRERGRPDRELVLLELRDRALQQPPQDRALSFA
jgi:hypothetical protein